ANLIAVQLGPPWLIAGRPEGYAFEITQKAIAAGFVAGVVFAPARHSEVTPAAVARPDAGEHHRIPAIRKQVGLGRQFVRTSQKPDVGELDIVSARRRGDFFRARMRNGNVTRRALLQQQLRRLNTGLRMKPVAHPSVEENVADGDYAH